MRSHSAPRSRSTIMESQGPAGRTKGTCAQLVDRYMTLGKDALKDGDSVLAENFFQHAEHYRRLASHFHPACEEEESDQAMSGGTNPGTTKIMGPGANSCSNANPHPTEGHSAPRKGRRVYFNRSVPQASTSAADPLESSETSSGNNKPAAGEKKPASSDAD